MTDNKAIMKTADEEEDDKCSEFSVISYCEERQSNPEELNGASDAVRPLTTYAAPSEVESELIDDNSDLVVSFSEPVEVDNQLAELPVDGSTSPWNPMMLSGYLKATAVVEMMDKVLSECKNNGAILEHVGGLVKELKEKNYSEQQQQLDEMSQLKADLVAARARIEELESRKSQEQQEQMSDLVSRLEQQLQDQCQLNKALREELDEIQDELLQSRIELSNQRMIVSVLREDNDSQRLSNMCQDYESQSKTLEKYYERGEVEF